MEDIYIYINIITIIFNAIIIKIIIFDNQQDPHILWWVTIMLALKIDIDFFILSHSSLP